MEPIIENVRISNLLKILLAGLILNCTIIAQNSDSIKERLDRYFENRYFNDCFVICQIFDLDSGEIVYDRLSEKLARPASLLKIITSSAAVQYLGEDYAFVTNLYYNGTIRDSVLWGSVFVKGAGDPDFSSKDLRYFVHRLKSLGINEINGNILGDVSLFDSLKWGNGWMWDDDPDADFSYFTPLIVDNAAVSVAVSPGEIGEPANVELYPVSDYYSFENRTTTTNYDTSDVEVSRNWLENGNNLFAEGEVSFREGIDTTKVNLVRPDNFFLYRFAEILKSEGVNVYGILDTAVTPDSAVYAGSVARSISIVIRNMNEESDNLSAEMLLRAMAAKYYGTPASAKKGVKVLNSYLKDLSLNPSKYKIVDGSGVSHYNLISAEPLLTTLKAIYTVPSLLTRV